MAKGQDHNLLLEFQASKAGSHMVQHKLKNPIDVWKLQGSRAKYPCPSLYWLQIDTVIGTQHGDLQLDLVRAVIGNPRFSIKL